MNFVKNLVLGLVRFLKNLTLGLLEVLAVIFGFLAQMTIMFIGVILGMIGFTGISMVANGIALSILWKWFIVSLFGLPIIPIPSAIGICLLVTLLKRQAYSEKDNQSEKEEYEKYEKNIKGFYLLAKDSFLPIISKIISGPGAILLLGWIIQKFL